MKLTLKELQEIETNILRDVVAVCNQNNLLYFMVYGSVLGTVRHSGPIPWDYDVDIAIPIGQLNVFIEVLRKELPEKYYINYHDNDLYYPELFPRIGLKGYSTKTLHLDVFLLVGAPTQKRKQFWFKTKFRFYMYAFKYGGFNEIYFGQFTTFKQKFFVPIVKTLLLPFSSTYIKKRFTRLANKYPFSKAEFIVNAQFGYGMNEFIPKDYYNEGVEMEYSDLKVRIPEKYDDYLTHVYGDYMQIPSEKQRQVPEHYRVDKRQDF